MWIVVAMNINIFVVTEGVNVPPIHTGSEAARHRRWSVTPSSRPSGSHVAPAAHTRLRRDTTKELLPDDWPACAELIGLFSRGLGADVPRDPVRARVYAEKGCKAHDAQSCQAQSLFATIDTGETGIAQSNAQFEARCNAGVLLDCGYLGERLLAGKMITADRARGLALLDKACKGGVTRACQKLADAGR